MMARVVAHRGTPGKGAPVTKSTTHATTQGRQVTATVAHSLISQVPRGKILPCVPDTRVTWQWWGSTTFFSECDIQIMNNWIAFGEGVISAVAGACAYWAARCVKALAAVGVAVTVSEVGALVAFAWAVATVIFAGYVALINNDDQACHNRGVFIDRAFSPPGLTWIDSVC